METNKKRSIRSFSGFLVIISIYVILILIALSTYPKFNPFTNTLAQLGNPKINPSGAIYFYASTVVVSSPLFFAAFLLITFGKKWIRSLPRRGKFLLYASLIFMLTFAFLNILTAVVPAGTNDPLNSLFSLIFFISFELFAILSAVGIRQKTNHIKGVPELGFAVVIINILLLMILIVGKLTIASWMLTMASWAYMVALTYEFSSMQF